jgi:RNA polymerase sigma factor (sigma-70 family)
MVKNEEILMVEKALAGDSAACAGIRSKDNTRWIEALLVKRGASSTEATDLTADLFADCFGAKLGKPPLLTKFNGLGKLRAFLSRAAINRLIDLKRHQKFEGDLPQANDDTSSGDEFDLLESDQFAQPSEDTLVALLRDCLSVAFSECAPLSLVVLRLVFVNRVNQAKVGAMLGWSQSKVSRVLNSTMEHIRDVTLREVHEADPWLELEWEDFITLCRSSTDFLVGEPKSSA